VFSIAEDVHVQSGIWSFCFTHRRGQDGIGMVTPLNADPESLPSDITTRITLRLSSQAHADYDGLLDAVAEMSETTIFFLKKLQKIHINTTAIDGGVTRTTFKKQKVGPLSSSVKLIRTVDSGLGTHTNVSLYRCVSHTINDMPVDEKRNGRTSAQVELAFPVDPGTKQPKISELGQHVFAFLPLQRLPQVQVSFVPRSVTH
jgi:hypothetical protein